MVAISTSNPSLFAALFLLSLILIPVAAAQTPGQWPTDTTATASTTHADLGDGTNFSPANAIDNNIMTKWNDDSVDAYTNDALSIFVPQLVTLAGIQIYSGQSINGGNDGYITNFYVQTAASTAAQWVTASIVSDSNTAIDIVTFATPVACTQVKIVVLGAQFGTAGNFSRINEVYPIYGTLVSTTTSSSSSTPTSSTSTSSTPSSSATSTQTPISTPKSSNTGAIVGGVVGGIGGLLLIGIIAFFLIRRRNKNKRAVAVPPASMQQTGYYSVRNNDGPEDVSKPHSELPTKQPPVSELMTSHTGRSSTRHGAVEMP